MQRHHIGQKARGDITAERRDVGERRLCRHHGVGEEACGDTNRGKKCLEALKVGSEGIKGGGMWRHRGSIIGKGGVRASWERGGM